MSSRLALVTAYVSTDGYNPVVITNASAQQAKQAYDGTQTLNGPATFYSVPIPVNAIDRYRFQFTCPATGAPAGTLTLQATLDEVINSNQLPNVADQPIANWAPLSFSVNGAAFASSFAIANATQIVLDENACNYAWVRAQIVLTSGSLLATIRMRNKGVQGR